MATILIVEDDIDTNEAVCEYLQEAGHNTVPAFDGDEAIKLFSENKINLVVLDIMLPTITGLAVLNSIRKTSQVPVLMLTAMEDEQTQVASFDGQADDYMTKPFSMVILGKRIAVLLRRSNLAEFQAVLRGCYGEWIERCFTGPQIAVLAYCRANTPLHITFKAQRS